MKRINLLLISSAFLIFFGCSSDGGDTENPTNQEEPDVTSEPINCQISTQQGNVFAMSSQGDLFVFKERYGKCETVDGSIVIALQGDYDTEDEFANLRHINGDLTLINVDPTIDLGGLDNLVSISGDLIYESIMPLNGGFESLETIGGDLVFVESDATEITGFPSLTNIDGSLLIKDNLELLSINGFNALETCLNIEVSKNFKLDVVDGFQNVKTIKNDLIFYVNTRMTNLIGFENLETVEGEELRITGHVRLPSIPTFSKLHNVSGKIELLNLECDLIDAFPALKTCTDIGIGISVLDGELTFSGFKELEVLSGSLSIIATSATEIDAFDKLQEVSGDFSISGQNLINLDFAVNLESIGGYLDISGCPRLEAINDFGNLTSVGSYIMFERNDGLQSITGFENLTDFDNDIFIKSNQNLKLINGFNGLSSFEILNILFNESLEVVSGFDSLTTMTDLRIGGGRGLQRIDAFQNLESVANSVAFGGSNDGNRPIILGFQKLKEAFTLSVSNTAVEDLSFLSSFTSVSSLKIEGNSDLLNLDGLSSLTGNLGGIEI